LFVWCGGYRGGLGVDASVGALIILITPFPVSSHRGKEQWRGRDKRGVSVI
jgi:hypothetical protein